MGFPFENGAKGPARHFVLLPIVAKIVVEGLPDSTGAFGSGRVYGPDLEKRFFLSCKGDCIKAVLGKLPQGGEHVGKKELALQEPFYLLIQGTVLFPQKGEKPFRRRILEVDRVDKFSPWLTLPWWLIIRTVHIFGRRATVWTSQFTTVMISAMNFGPRSNPNSPTATANEVALLETTGAFSMASCGSCAQEHPGVIFPQTMELE